MNSERLFCEMFFDKTILNHFPKANIKKRQLLIVIIYFKCKSKIQCRHMYLLKLDNIFHNNELKSSVMILFVYCSIIKMILIVGLKIIYLPVL